MSVHWTHWPQMKWGTVCGSTQHHPQPLSPSLWLESARWKTMMLPPFWSDDVTYGFFSMTASVFRTNTFQIFEKNTKHLPLVEGCQRTQFSDQPSQSYQCKAEQRKVLEIHKNENLAFIRLYFVSITVWCNGCFSNLFIAS